tara:strand:- start:318 stop:761 length:444 start_codon:yes stop_codon:yes gene_type:complete
MTPPDELPKSMTLKPNLITWSLVMLCGCGMLALTFLGNDTEGWMHILGILLGCGLVVTSLVCLWPNSTWIKLGPDGLRMRILFRDIHYRWCDINGLSITAVRTGYANEKFVTFGVGPHNAPHSLPSGFGINADRLLEQIESYWKCYR